MKGLLDREEADGRQSKNDGSCVAAFVALKGRSVYIQN